MAKVGSWGVELVGIDVGDGAIGHFPVELAVAGEGIGDAFFSVVFDGFGDGLIADSFEVEDFFPKSIHTTQLNFLLLELAKKEL